MINHNDFATMHSYWIAQRNIAKLQEGLRSALDLRTRNILETLLQTEERKIAAINCEAAGN